MDVDSFKRAAAARAVEQVQPGMKVGLGTGSTASHFVDLLAERVAGGLNIVGVPTSEATRANAERQGIPLTTLNEALELDLTVDGADEIDSDLNAIKGGGGALLREKIVAAASARMIVVADSSKLVRVLGHFPLPIEVVTFGLGAVRRAIEKAVAAAGCPGPALLRRGKDGLPFVTDGGHFILDAAIERIPDSPQLAARLAEIPGVVEHGLFINLVDTAIIADSAGVRMIEKPRSV
jgi:ribose 5-phosphate isomerase A